MIDLARHIEILLLGSDCVIVPDFGGFMAHHVDARYDEAEGVYLPPQRTLGFNSQLTLNDSLLAQSYIEAYDISYPEALRRIADEVRELRQHLDNTGSYTLAGLGTLSLNEYGKLDFQPCEAGILTPELYGMGTVSIPLLDTAAKGGRGETPATQAGTATESTPLSVAATLRYVAAACIVALVVILIPSPAGEGHSSVLRGMIDTEMISRILPQASVSGQQQVERAMSHSARPAVKRQVKAPAAPATEAPAKEAEAKGAEAPTPYYTVVVCSKVGERSATRYAESLRAEGYAEAEALLRGSNSRVIIGRYATEREAAHKAMEMSREEEFSGCWTLRVRS